MDKQENTLLLTSQSCSFSSIRSATKLVFDIRRKIAITIPERMCADHDSLESVVFKSPVKKIERYAFSNCPRLQEVIFEQSVSSIDYNAFSNCPRLQEVIFLITSLTQLQSHIPEKVTKVIFDIKTEDAITIPAYMCAHHDSLESVIFKNPIKIISWFSFCDCPRLREVIFEQSVDLIETGAFFNTAITQIHLNHDVIIKDTAFDNCGDHGETLTIVTDGLCPNIQKFAKRNGIGYSSISEEKRVQYAEKSTYPITIKANNLNVTIKGKRILSDVSIKIEPGEMIMIIGGSGTGKSTLVKHLFGLESGWNIVTVQANGETIIGEVTSKKVQKLLKNKIFYAPQFTISNNDLTVEQEIQKNALMFRPEGKYTPSELEQLARQFSLWDSDHKLLNTLVRRISGGQKKKLLMACSQASKPQILVFDEPDSGLDEPSAFNLFIQDVREREGNRKGRTGIVISHHPHNSMNHFRDKNRRVPFDEIFTRLVVLAKEDNKKGGTIAFSGTPREAKSFFGLKNDPYSRIVSLVMPKEEGGESEPDEIKKYIHRYRAIINN